MRAVFLLFGCAACLLVGGCGIKGSPHPPPAATTGPPQIFVPPTGAMSAQDGGTHGRTDGGER